MTNGQCFRVFCVFRAQNKERMDDTECQGNNKQSPQSLRCLQRMDVIAIFHANHPRSSAFIPVEALDICAT